MDSYSVTLPGFMPVHNLVHSLKYSAEVRGVAWRMTDNTAFFQAPSMYTEEDVQTAIRVLAGQHAEAVHITHEAYKQACSEACFCFTAPAE